MRKSEKNSTNNVYSIEDGSKVSESELKRRNKESFISPSRIGALIFILVFAYLAINLYIYSKKEQVGIYEVQGYDLNYDTEFTGLCLRNDEVVTSPYSGYANYFIRNGARTAKNSVVFSVDSGSSVYNKLKASYEDIVFSEEDIATVKSLIYKKKGAFDGSDMSVYSGFGSSINDCVFDIVNDNMLNSLKTVSAADSSGEGVRLCRSDSSGIISYFSDSFVGMTADEIGANYFEKDVINSYSVRNLKSEGLIASGDAAYRICSDENWSLIVNVSEDFYINNLDKRELSCCLNGSLKSVTGAVRFYSDSDKYFALLSFDSCMAEYFDDRYVSVTFTDETAGGLKVPVSAVAGKDFYVIPLSVFMGDLKLGTGFLNVELYDQSSGVISYKKVSPEKFYSDGYYAYIDMEILNQGDYICNTDTGERVKVQSVNSIDGVYNVNKGYYVFTRIERLRSNSDYVIVKSNTKDGLRLYDHIALDARDAVDQAIIY